MEPLTVADFENRTHGRCSLPKLGRVAKIVGLREMAQIDCIVAMTTDYLTGLMQSVTLVGDPTVRPYANSRIVVRRMDPEGMRLCQTFIERGKLLRFHESLRHRFHGHEVSRGISKLKPFIALGRMADDAVVAAHYLPPIVELRDGRVLVDGTHRNSHIMTSGTTIETIHVYDVTTPLPCSPVRWEQMKFVDQKPALEDRYQDFNQAYFRDLKGLGIDA